MKLPCMQSPILGFSWTLFLNNNLRETRLCFFRGSSVLRRLNAPWRAVRFCLVDREQPKVPDLLREHLRINSLCGRAYTDHP
jgi:hypothetical protein